MGGGFFQIQMPDGTTSYSRDGNFKINNTGQVVTASGFPLVPNVTIPENAASVTFGQDGTISVEIVAGGGSQNIGQVQIARFVNPSGLKPIGNNLFEASQASGVAQILTPGLNGAGALKQGSLEASNVNVVEEMVNMIETQRAYEMNSKSISAVDGMLKFLNQNI
jgi:flagellar basal-body rod protein FlgG